MIEQQKIEFLTAVTSLVHEAAGACTIERGFYTTKANAYDTREHIDMSSYHDEAGIAIGAAIKVSDIRINRYGNGEEVVEDFTVSLDRSSGDYCDSSVGEIITLHVDSGRLPEETTMPPTGYRIQHYGSERTGTMTEKRLKRAYYLLGVLASRGYVEPTHDEY